MSDFTNDLQISDLSIVSDDEKAFLASLPYRVGYWISQVDTTGGDESDEAEAQALECMITSFAQDMCKSEFAQRLMELTVAHKDDWLTWHDNLQAVPDECRRACEMLSGRLSEKELKGFQENLYEIGLAVAGIYREEDPAEESALNRLVKRIKDAFPFAGSGESHTNISKKERAALQELEKALGI